MTNQPAMIKKKKLTIEVYKYVAVRAEENSS